MPINKAEVSFDLTDSVMLNDSDSSMQLHEIEDEQIEEPKESSKFGFWSAFGLNTMMMFGTGPFISIPYTIASVDPSGSHALVGYSIAVLACICDSFICSEIGSMFPSSGGPVIYLQTLYGEKTLGQLAAFIYLFQFTVAGPAEVASGFIALSDYFIYFNTDKFGYGIRVGISLGTLAFSSFLLFASKKSITVMTALLTVITLSAVGLTVMLGLGNLDSNLIKPPNDAFDGNVGSLLWRVGAATRFGVYDMTGYYHVCYLGDEIQNPRKNIPYVCVGTAIFIGFIDLLIYIAVLGVIDWRVIAPIYSDNSDGEQIGIMSLFYEKLVGEDFAKFFTVMTVITIFGSTYSMMAGFQHLLHSGARDGFLFDFLKKRHHKTGVPYMALSILALISSIWCFFDVDVVIDAATTLLILVQNIGQAVGLLYYRWRTPKQDQVQGWRMPLYPLPVIIQLILFSYIFVTSPAAIHNDQPILDICLLFIFIGVCLFFIRAKIRGLWPFQKDEKNDIEDQISANAHNDVNGNDTFEDHNKFDHVSDSDQISADAHNNADDDEIFEDNNKFDHISDFNHNQSKCQNETKS